MLQGKGLLTAIQKKFLTIFSSLPDAQKFYFGGGTALAEFYLGHRLSYDLDFFTAENGLILPFSEAIQSELVKKGFSLKMVRRLATFAEFNTSKNGEITTIHLAYESPFRFTSLVDTNLGVKVNDRLDIFLDKLLTFFSRAEPRDAIDLFFILKQENFWKLLELAPQKDPGFDLYWMAVALGKVQDFPDEIGRWPVDMLVEVDVKELKNKFSSLAREIMDKIKRR
ncbi:MAG: nucleotidyl transferase AbiEii/AbiGii toxin family protein [Thermodesulfobacteriota bacterium]